jgi:ribonucleoside-diphosphate reductase alpha chain
MTTIISQLQKNYPTGETPPLLTLLQAKVYFSRYAKRDGLEIVEYNPHETFKRVAVACALVDASYKESVSLKEMRKLGPFTKALVNTAQQYLDIMDEGKFSPGGRTLTNAGIADRHLVSNCLVLHPGDSMKSIFKTLQEAAILQQRGSGIGFPLHTMRPRGTKYKRNHCESSGPVGFLKMCHTTFEVIKGQNRSGANMGMMHVNHPDILEFICCKELEGSLTTFNITVLVTDAFMEQATDYNHPLYNDMWVCHWKKHKYPLKVTASQLFKQICKLARTNGEPGIAFYDEIQRTNPLPGLGSIEASVPCGEQFLHDADACNLGSLNLSKFINPHTLKLDEKELARVTELATIMLDDVIDMTDFSSKRVQKTSRKNRRIGLGIMGLADALLKMRVSYASEEGRAIASRAMEIINITAINTSIELGIQRGCFQNHEHSIYSGNFKEGRMYTPMRNASLTNNAPSGSISLFGGCSNGIEPMFAFAYRCQGIMTATSDEEQLVLDAAHILIGNTKEDAMQIGIHPILRDALLEENVNLYESGLAECIELCGSIQTSNLERSFDVMELNNHFDITRARAAALTIPKWIRKVYVGSQDISPRDHIAMQAALQKHCDNAISKTINMPRGSTVLDVQDCYEEAWRSHVKGCTVYVDGSRDKQVLSTNMNQVSMSADFPAPSDNSSSCESYSGDDLFSTQICELDGSLKCVRCTGI